MMSRKRKVSTQTEPKVESELTTYRVFFHECVTRKLVQSWQEKEIHAFFKDLGLSDNEPADRYKIALAKF